MLDFYKPHAYLEQPSLKIYEIEIYIRTYYDHKGIFPDTSMRRLARVIRRSC